MTIFLFSLAGIPPLGGWFAKFVIFQALASAGTTGRATSLAVVVGVNSVIALFYYARVAREMWIEAAPDGDVTPIRVPASLAAALVITVVVTLVLGVVPGRRHPLHRHGHASLAPRPLSRATRPLGRRSTLLEPRSPSRIRRRGPIAVRRGRRPRARTTRTHGFYATGGGGRAGGATSSPAPRSVRCSARWWPVRSTSGGTSSGGPIRSSWSRPAPARAPWPDRPGRGARVRGGAALRARRAVRRAARRARRPPAAERADAGLRAAGRRRRRSASTGAGDGPASSRSATCRRRRSSAWCWPTSCSTTCPSTCSSARRRRLGRGARRRSTTATDARRAARCPPTTPTPPGRSARARRRRRAPVPLQPRPRRVAGRRARPRRAGSRGRRRLRRHDRRAGRPPLDGVAAHLPRPRAAADHPLDALGHPGHHRARWPSTSSPRRPPADRVDPGRVPRAPTASTSWSTRAARSGTSGPHLGDLDGHPGPEPRPRGRGAPRPRRPRRLPRPRVVGSDRLEEHPSAGFVGVAGRSTVIEGSDRLRQVLGEAEHQLVAILDSTPRPRSSPRG